MQMASRVVPDSAQLRLLRLRADVAACQAPPPWSRKHAARPSLAPESQEKDLTLLPFPRPFSRPTSGRAALPRQGWGGRGKLWETTVPRLPRVAPERNEGGFPVRGLATFPPLPDLGPETRGLWGAFGPL